MPAVFFQDPRLVPRQEAAVVAGGGVMIMNHRDRCFAAPNGGLDTDSDEVS